MSEAMTTRARKPTVAKVALATTVIAMLLLTGYVQRPTALNLVKQSGELVVVTRNSPITYYEGPDGVQTGFEYELAQMFADELGVRLKMVVPDDFHSILSMVSRGEANIAAAGLTVTEARKKRVRFAPAYQTITQQVVYRSGAKAPRSLEDLNWGYTEVVGGSSHAERLRHAVAGRLPGLDWHEDYNADIEELLSRVWNRDISYTIADSLDVRFNQRFYPELRVAFDLGKPEELAWALPKTRDNTLYDKVSEFFAKIKANGQLALLQEKHFGHIQKFDYVGTRKFIQHINERLPRYLDYFRKAATKQQLDWHLLAAIGYQESHWNPHAVSPTGVRGIMMLTRSTAADLGIKNRIDPKNSIYGGARYFRSILGRIPDSVQEPDRVWFALAAYNMGLGHLRDALILTRERGGNPDTWLDVRDTLPLLMQKRWYRKTRHGYARGIEAVKYVENIRSYYDMLLWQTDDSGADPRITTLTQLDDGDNRDSHSGDEVAMSPIL